MLTKTYDFTLDIKNKVNNDIPKIDIVQGDYKTNILNITLTADFIPLDITGLTVNVGFKKADKTVVLDTSGSDTLTIPNALTGSIKCILRTQAISYVGDVIATVSLVDSVTNEKLTSTEFKFKVRESIDNGSALLSTNDIPILTQLIGTTQSLVGSVETLEDTVTVNENTRANAEDVRKTNEVSRVNAEEARHTEVIAARGTYETLNNRLDNSDNQLANVTNQWQTWIPTLTWVTAIPVGVTTIARYKVIGKTVFYKLKIKATDGNGATGITISLPSDCIPKTNDLMNYVYNIVAVNSVASASRAVFLRDNGVNNDLYYYYMGTATAGQTLQINMEGIYEIA
jgi:hypothetical protein